MSIFEHGLHRHDLRTKARITLPLSPLKVITAGLADVANVILTGSFSLLILALIER